jgi:hypothetical protein
MSKTLRALLAASSLLAGLLSSAAFAADSPDQSLWGYAEFGSWDSARQVVIGIESPWPIHYQGDNWTTFWQAELGEWFTRKDNASYQSSTEIAFGPVGRYYLTSDQAWYAEGIANIGFITPRYWRGAEQEGSAFDFGGGFNFGYRFGASRSSELSLGAEHFSNGGYRDPNPGRNFFQVRYSIAF